MTALMDAILTGATCGDACWHAREDVCRCSCGGANHACLRTGDGEQPTRTCRIQRHVYTLYAVVESYRDGHLLETKINRAAKDAGIANPYIGYDGKQNGFYEWRSDDHDRPAQRKTATATMLKAWPELAAYRTDQPYDPYTAPSVIWIRTDYANAEWLPTV
jgi:hypothetical protein